MEKDGLPATPDDTAAPADDKPTYATENDLDFEMTPEQEQSFINEQLGIIDEPIQAETPKADEQATPAGDNDAADDEEPEKEAPAPVPEAKATDEEDKPKAPEVAEPETPDEIKTDDLFIEVDKVTVDDDGVATTEKIKLVFNPNDPKSFIPDDFKFKNDKQLADILEAKQEMVDLYKTRQGELETKQAEKAKQDAETQQIATWNAEVQDLVDAGVIEAPKGKEGDPGYDLIDSVYKFMTEENKARIESGKPVIQSFGTAFTMFSKIEADKAAADEVKKDNDDAKKKGALVGGSSAASATADTSYVAGSHGNIWDIPIED